MINLASRPVLEEGTAAGDSRNGGSARPDWLGLAAVFILALGLRVWFVGAGTVENALRRSDTLDYLQYAFNLTLYQTFSHSHIADGPLQPDSFRDPGYPTFLAALLLPLDFTDAWYAAVLGIQVLLGALTACLAMLIARRWLPPHMALGAGMMSAVWPHSVVFCGYVLSETLFGFILSLAVWMTCRALEAGTRLRWFAAGFGFGAAAMVNATVAPLAALLALLLWRRSLLTARLAMVLLAGSLLLPGAWAMRAWSIPGDRAPTGRAAVNLVQGSWPEYHESYIRALAKDAAALARMRAIDLEQELMLRSPSAGFASIGARFRTDPWRYLGWYAWKPALLWAWSIRMGWGDIYVYPVAHSIYLSNPVMPAVEALCFALNPGLFLLMMAAVVAVLFRPNLATGRPGLLVVVALVGFETLVYTALQSEPRYSVPLRPFEMILTFTTLQGLLWWRAGRNEPTVAAPRLSDNNQTTDLRDTH